MHNIFISVSGSTPQIITETLYVYAVEKKLHFEEIHIITTTHGKEQVNRELLAKNRLYHLCEDYGLDPQTLPSPRITLIEDSNGKPLEDVRTLSDNECAARTIINFIRDYSQKPDTRLLCSLAGGRKTMSAYMALALNFFGRKQDRLSHILVSPPAYEFNRDFFYPAPNQKDVVLQLAEIPFVRLRETLEKHFNLSTLEFTDLVKLNQMSEDELSREVVAVWNLEKKCLKVTYGTEEFTILFPLKLSLVFDAFFSSEEPKEITDSMIKALKRQYLEFKFGPGLGTDVDNNPRFPGKFDLENIQKGISEINISLLEKKLPPLCSSLLKIKHVDYLKYQIPLKFSQRYLVE